MNRLAKTRSIMNEKTVQLLQRTFYFGVDILKFLNTLPFNYVYKGSISQLSKSSTSIGANYEEAQGAASKRDFNNKIGISYREARESVYWLRILNELYPEIEYKQEFETLKNEATELKKIFAAIKLSSK